MWATSCGACRSAIFCRREQSHRIFPNRLKRFASKPWLSALATATHRRGLWPMKSKSGSPTNPSVPCKTRSWNAPRVGRDGIELWFATAAAVLAIAAVAIVAALLIERQRRLAESLAIERDAARVQAETGFREAQHAVDDLFTRVSEDTLLNQPGTQQLRKELLEKTLTYYKRFIRELLERSGASRRTWGNVFPPGRIVKDLQSPGEALEYYDDARKLQQSLLAKTPSDTNRLKSLADTLNAIGEVQHRAQRLDEARKAYQQSLDIRRQLADQAPKDSEALRLLANSYMNVGLEEKDEDRLDAAAASFQLAQKIRANLLKDHPDLIAVRRDLAMGCFDQGLLDVKAKNLASAGENFNASIRLFGELINRQPRDMNLQYRLAICYRLLGDLRAVERATEESNAAYATRGFHVRAVSSAES